MAAQVGRVLVYGGKGALGATCVAHFKSKNWVRPLLTTKASCTLVYLLIVHLSALH